MGFPNSFRKIYGLVEALSSPMVLTQVASEIALKLVGGPNLAQIFEVFDQFGNPIFTIPTDGGPAVLGDRFRAFRPGSIVNDDWDTMTKSTDNVVVDAAGMHLGHGLSQGCAIFMGNGLPTASNPVSTGLPPNGSVYFRIDGVGGSFLYHLEAGVWQPRA